MEKNDFIYITWEQLYRDAVELSRKILQSNYCPDFLIAIARGGWVIGRILSDLLGIRDVLAVTVKFYEGVKTPSGKPILLQELNADLSSKKLLLVDDIVDTGETLKETLKHVNARKPLDVKTATLYVKSWSPLKPDFYVREYSKWVVFPYELKETFRNASLSQGLLLTLKEAGLSEEILHELLKG
ncbi:MAG: phosphoribosyltransferase [Thermofilum sp.]|jgi:hypoxanthine phosphoribosyltransferase|nr:phosphoribosyltransferase [Thermofilum sp.]